MLFNTKVNTKVLDRIVLNDEDLMTIHDTNSKMLHADTKEAKELLEEVSKMEINVSGKGILKITHLKEHIRESAKGNPMYKDMGLEDISIQFLYDLFAKDGITLYELDDNDNMKYRVVFDEKCQVKTVSIYNKLMKQDEARSRPIIETSIGVYLNAIVEFVKYANLMSYLKQDSAIVKKQSVIKKPKGKTKKQLQREAREQARGRVSVSSEVKTYDYSNAEREGEKRKYERHTESWTSRGYWKTMKKSGKRVWVKGSIKGDKSGQTKGKDYTV